MRWIGKKGIKGSLVSFLSRFREAINLAHNWILFYAWRLSTREGRDFSALRAVKWKITCWIKHSREFAKSNLVIKIIGKIIIERGNKKFLRSFDFDLFPKISKNILIIRRTIKIAKKEKYYSIVKYQKYNNNVRNKIRSNLDFLLLLSKVKFHEK